jgi:threonyl-tRNA synthetase
VLSCLEFMKFVYGVLGMTYRLELSTKPEKALGDAALWDVAESVSGAERSGLICCLIWGALAVWAWAPRMLTPDPYPNPHSYATPI